MHDHKEITQAKKSFVDLYTRKYFREIVYALILNNTIQVGAIVYPYNIMIIFPYVILTSKYSAIRVVLRMHIIVTIGRVGIIRINLFT